MMCDDRTQKMLEDWDCRAISDTLLTRFVEGDLKRFIDLVKSPKYKNDHLEFVLRGNDHPKDNPLSGGEAIIYMNNHAVFTISPQTLSINPNYFRYDPDWEIHIDDLIKTFHFKKKAELGKVKKSTKGWSRSFGSQRMTVDIKNIEDLDKLYKFWAKVLKTFFDEDEYQIDQFLKDANMHDEKYKGKIEQKTKKGELEKKRQQQLYSAMSNVDDGYYFYDMEFQQKHKCQGDADKDRDEGLSNNPDMQAIRFEGGKPVAWVMVEVKSKTGAFYGDSGIKSHVDSMKKYISEKREYVKKRKREAFLLFTQYSKLGLMDEKIELSESVFYKCTEEIILVFTDKEVISSWDNYKKNITKGDYKEIKDNIPDGMLLVSGIEDIKIEEKDKDIREH